MLIIIEYKGEKVKAVVLSTDDDYAAEIIVDDFRTLFHVDQCRHCGLWCSEDDELYGDGYCTHCAVMCGGCQNYFCHTDMIKDKDAELGLICKECHLKEAKKLWGELTDIPINDDEEIDEDWREFLKGTPREDIWHWFEKKYNISVAKDLMGV